MQEEISILIQAQYPLIYLVTPEEERAERAIARIAQESKSQQRRVFVWTVTHGIVEYGQSRHITQHNTVSPEAAIQWVIQQKEAGIFIFKDLHPFIDSPATTRWLRDAIAGFKGTQKVIVLMSPVQQVPIELEKEVVVLDYPLPDLS
ncbi:MAG: AAA family ATPase, partial [Cyanobacteriota bacterium]